MRRRPAELVVDPGVVDHVVAMGAPGCRLEHRRRVDVADAERRQVRHHLGGGVEAEFGLELEPVGGERRRQRSAEAAEQHQRA